MSFLHHERRFDSIEMPITSNVMLKNYLKYSGFESKFQKVFFEVLTKQPFFLLKENVDVFFIL